MWHIIYHKTFEILSATEKSRKSAPSIRRINTITKSNGHLEGSSLLWKTSEMKASETVQIDV